MQNKDELEYHEENEDNVEEASDEDDNSEGESMDDNDKGFVITENIDDTNYYEQYQNEVLERIKQRKQKKSVPSELLEKDLPIEEYEKMPVKFVKPFNYVQLRAKQQSRGVIYVQKPFIINQMDKRFSNENNVRQYFREYGNITRIQPSLEGADQRVLTGWYIEFDSRSLAKRLALTLNGSPISPNDSRTLSVKYMPNFKWSEYVEKHERKEMYAKMLRAEAEKELKTLRAYKQNKRLSSLLKDGKISKPKSMFNIKQRGVTKVELNSQAAHIQSLPIL